MVAAKRELSRLLIFGPPGAGKGTQAEYIAAQLRIPAISTGEMLRAAVAEGNELGQMVDSIMAKGALVDDGTMAGVVRARLVKEDARDGFLLDGYPRTRGQAETLATILQEQDIALDAVIYLDVPEDVLVDRVLARGRADDQEEVIRERIKVYERKTKPVLDFYRGDDLILSVDGNQGIDEVRQSIDALLGEST